MNLHSFKIVTVESELYEWDKPPIWNGMHVYDKGRLHLIKVTASTVEPLQPVRSTCSRCL